MCPFVRLTALWAGAARPITIAVTISTVLFAHSPALADLRPAAGYSVEVVRQPGAIFSGVARDGPALLITDLAAGRLLRRNGDGLFSAFGPMLPYGVDILGEPTGPYRIARHGPHYLVTSGWTPMGKEKSRFDHALLEVDDRRVVRVIRDDFLNPFDFAVIDDDIIVIDAGRNSIERLAMAGSVKETVFSFARLSAPKSALKHLSPTEFTDQESYEFDAVPTSLVAAHRRIYVTLFGGFPFLPGSGRLVSLPLDGEATSARIEAVDLNAPVDTDIAPDGRLLVLEHGIFIEGSGFRAESGRLISIDVSSGEHQLIIDGLTRPATVLVVDQRTMAISELGGALVFIRRITQ
jgi:hypothetical protein